MSLDANDAALVPLSDERRRFLQSLLGLREESRLVEVEQDIRCELDSKLRIRFLHFKGLDTSADVLDVKNDVAHLELVRRAGIARKLRFFLRDERQGDEHNDDEGEVAHRPLSG